jgi:hypothetical protein
MRHPLETSGRFAACALALLLLFSIGAHAGPPTAGQSNKKDESKKQLDFDGDVVEGMNRQPLDSLTQVSEGDGSGAKNHLYHRVRKFDDQNRELGREIVETYR